MSTCTVPWTRDHNLVASQGALVTFLSALSGYVAVLNPDRRFIWVSPDLQGRLKAPVASMILGRRPGEVFGCPHAADSVLGCGGSLACYNCPAIQAILESKRLDARVARAGTIELDDSQGRRSVEIEFTAAPWVLEGRQFTVIAFR